MSPATALGYVEMRIAKVVGLAADDELFDYVVVEETYVATVEVEGPRGVQSVDARPSDALNLAVLVQAPIFVAPEVLQEAEARRTGIPPQQHACVGHWQLHR